MDNKIFSYFHVGSNLIDHNQIFPLKPSEFKICLSVDVVIKNLPKITEIFLRFWKAHSFQMFKISIPNPNSTIWDMNASKFHIHILNTFQDINRQRAFWSGRLILEKNSGYNIRKLVFIWSVYDHFSRILWVVSYSNILHVEGTSLNSLLMN